MAGKNKDGIQPHTSKGTPSRHVDFGKGAQKQHAKVKSNVGATALFGARKAAKGK